MNLCINIIRTEGQRDGWVNQLTPEDVDRILARYKEHVTYWNIRIEPIRAELQALADAISWSFYSVAQRFDGLPPRRFPAVILHNFARLQKDVFVPWPQNPQNGTWTITNFTQDDVNYLEGNLHSFRSASGLRILTPTTLCEIQGQFTIEEFDSWLKQLQPYPTNGYATRYRRVAIF